MSAAEQPLSTLSADADTASYANLRRLVRSGAGLGTIDPGAVRIEEMLNYFDYDYAAPAEGEDFALTARAGACPWNAESELVVLGLTVGQAVTEAPPTNLVLLVDVSGSMGDAEKLPLLKESIARIVKGLRAEDRVSIVTYSGVEEVVLKGASGDDAEAILGAINGLEAAGSTNGEAGLSMAYRVAEETHIEGGVNRIVMASDGDLNVGISSEDELNAFVSEKRARVPISRCWASARVTTRMPRWKRWPITAMARTITSIPPTRQPASTSVFWPPGRFLWPTM